jgi:glycosyltransferase involved in cell wall biosynthesis
MDASAPPEPPRPNGLRIGFFGSFYPSSERAGSFSTSLVWELARSPKVSRVEVFGPPRSALPPGGDARRVAVRAAWTPDDPTSIARAGWAMVRARSETDVYLFSIYVTAFGRRPAANALGLLLPTFVRIATGRPVFVYMHNLLETQDPGTLGYTVSRSARVGVRLLERLLTLTTRLIVPLRSMRTVVERDVGGDCEVRVLPFLEPLFAATRPGAAPIDSLPIPPSPPVRILLFGYWGPQKDLRGALNVLEAMVRDGAPVEVTIAGEANPGFPEYAKEIDAARRRLPTDRFHFVGRVEEEAVFPMARGHHVLLLPYRATGGISGVMNVGALADLDLAAYDVPQLREFANDLGEEVAFVRPYDEPALAQALADVVARRLRPGDRADRFHEKVARARSVVDAFVDDLRASAR